MPGGISDYVRVATLRFMKEHDGHATTHNVKEVMDDIGKSYAPSRVMNPLTDDGHCIKTDQGWKITAKGNEYLLSPDAIDIRIDVRRRNRPDSTSGKTRKANAAVSARKAHPPSPPVIAAHQDGILNLQQLRNDLQTLGEITQRQQELIASIETRILEAAESLRPFLSLLSDQDEGKGKTPTNRRGTSSANPTRQVAAV